MGGASIKKGVKIMTTYKSYAECKIANPDSEIVTPSIDSSMPCSMEPIFEVKVNHEIGKFAWVICNPADYCSSIKEFLEAGFKFSSGDLFTSIDGCLGEISGRSAKENEIKSNDDKRHILSVAALSGGCKIPPKAEQWTIYNNTLSLCELTDEQAAMLFNAWRGDGNMQLLNDDECWSDYDSGFYPLDVYRIKSKSERELFIEAVGKVIGYTDLPILKIGSELFDSGKFKYIDNTNHFGESI